MNFILILKIFKKKEFEMKIFILSSVALISSIAIAATKHYRIETQILVDGQLVSSPKVITNGDKATEISQISENPHKELRMKIIASDLTSDKVKDGILIKFDVEYVSGSKVVKASPQVLAKAGSEATIEIGNPESHQNLKMKIVATRE